MYEFEQNSDLHLEFLFATSQLKFTHIGLNSQTWSEKKNEIFNQIRQQNPKKIMRSKSCVA